MRGWVPPLAAFAGGEQRETNTPHASTRSIRLSLFSIREARRSRAPNPAAPLTPGSLHVLHASMVNKSRFRSSDRPPRDPEISATDFRRASVCVTHAPGDGVQAIAQA